MDKKKVIIVILSALLMVAIICRFYLDYKNKDNTLNNEIKVTDSSKKFKEEYESINGSKNSNDIPYLKVTIPDASTVTYKSGKDIVKVLQEGSGIIYFGFNTCPWCRSIVESLVNIANKRNVELYYVDVKDIRSSFKVENKKLVKITDGSEEYYKILEKLDSYLTDYIIVDNNKEYDTKEKRLYAPTVVAIKDGEIVDFHEGTVLSQENPQDGLSDEEKKEFENIYQKMIDRVLNDNCSQKGC